LALLSVALFGGNESRAQCPEVAEKYAQTITVEKLRGRLEVLAADSLEGRETGTRGQQKAAAYIEQQLKEMGLGTVPGMEGYRQAYGINVTYPDTVLLMCGKDTFRFLEDIYCFNLRDMVLRTEEVKYMGYGIHSPSYSDYGTTEVKGKVLMVSAGEPRRKERSLIDTSTYSSEWTTDWRKKILEASRRGAKALLVIDGKFSSSVVQLGRYINRPEMDVTGKNLEESMPVIFISSRLADRILRKGGEKKGHRDLEKRIEKRGETVFRELAIPLTLEVRRHREKLIGENVIGYLEGTDRKEEVVVVSCHYDHLGMKDGEIYNGADDDGSGTTALLGLADAFAAAKKSGHGPRRSIMFIAFSGEEKGLLGSAFYASNPVMPLERTMANLNIDMIGRIDAQHAPDSNYVYLIGADKISKDLHSLSERVNSSCTQLQLDYTYNDERDPNRFYYRSDHYNFAKNGIPVIFYFTGVHEDYHRPTDTVDKIMFPKMKRIVDLVFHTAWELANREQSLVKDQ
jgi:hypothetical protein